jgi:hypothetical protein
MQWVLKILRKHGLAEAQSVCIDATTLEAAASMKSLVRRDTGQSARRRRRTTIGPIRMTRRRALRK